MAQMPELETVRIIYEAVQRRLDEQFRSNENLDQKIGILIGFDGVILSIVLTLAREAELWLYGIGIGVNLLAIVLAVFAVNPRDYRFDPQPRSLQEKYSTFALRDVIAQLTSNLVQAYEFNRPRILKKARFFTLAIIFSCLSLAFLISSVIIYSKSTTILEHGGIVTPQASKSEAPMTEEKPNLDNSDQNWVPPKADPDLADYSTRDIERKDSEKAVQKQKE